MKLFIVAYDLSQPGQDWSVLISRLEQIGAIRILESAWLVKGSYTKATDLRDDLYGFMSENGRLFVGEMTRTAAWRRLMVSNEAAKAFIRP